MCGKWKYEKCQEIGHFRGELSTQWNLWYYFSSFHYYSLCDPYIAYVDGRNVTMNEDGGKKETVTNKSKKQTHTHTNLFENYKF